jgi:hypothetical protein
MRLAHDNYPTPPGPVHRLLERVRIPGGRWLEPAAGDGAIIRAVLEVHRDVQWTAVELRARCRRALTTLTPRVVIGDYLRLARTGALGSFDATITNPPYELALDYVQIGLRARGVLALLLRLNWLGSQHRAGLLREHMPDVYVLPNRPSFPRRGYRKGGTDATEYAWCVWPAGDKRRRTGRVEVLALNEERR